MRCCGDLGRSRAHGRGVRLGADASHRQALAESMQKALSRKEEEENARERNHVEVVHKGHVPVEREHQGRVRRPHGRRKTSEYDADDSYKAEPFEKVLQRA